ncbi:MAG: hypothetical protein ACFFD2_12215 [Promethearchaeota archaeon]
MKQIEEFLLKNGFKKLNNTHYENNKCDIYINYKAEYYLIKFVIDSHVYDVYTTTLKLTELVGELTWHDLIDKNYKI